MSNHFVSFLRPVLSKNSGRIPQAGTRPPPTAGFGFIPGAKRDDRSHAMPE